MVRVHKGLILRKKEHVALSMHTVGEILKRKRHVRQSFGGKTSSLGVQELSQRVPSVWIHASGALVT